MKKSYKKPFPNKESEYWPVNMTPLRVHDILWQNAHTNSDFLYFYGCDHASNNYILSSYNYYVLYTDFWIVQILLKNWLL